jgi:hypothetical protein
MAAFLKFNASINCDSRADQRASVKEASAAHSNKLEWPGRTGEREGERSKSSEIDHN